MGQASTHRPARRTPRRTSPALLCAVAAIVGGITAGGATVRGLEPRTYGSPPGPAPFARTATPSATIAAGREDATVAARCDECSERDLGYRWAILAAVRTPADCPNDSWAFRRGCLDHLEES